MSITRRNVLRSTAAGLAAFAVARRFAHAADPAPAMFAGKIETLQLADDLYVLSGAGGNVAVCFDPDRLLVIDSGVPARGPDLLNLATKFSPSAKGKTLFNTHWHFDHTGGNGAFVNAGYSVVGSTACRQRLGQTITMQDMGMTTEPAPEANRPTVTFDHDLSLFAPATVKITKFAPAHTDTDAIAFFEKHNVLHTGDLLFAGTFPVIDRSSGGSLDGMIAAAKQLLPLCTDKTRVIPGHGPVGDRSTIQAQLDLLQLAHDRLTKFADKKATMDEVLAAAPFADLDDKWGRGFVRSPLFTKMTYGQWLPK